MGTWDIQTFFFFSWCLEQFSDFGSMPVGILNLQAKGERKAQQWLWDAHAAKYL